MSHEVFKLKNCWLFDLDNTLYPSDSKIFDKIDLRMKKFISEKLKISFEKAFERDSIGTLCCTFLNLSDGLYPTFLLGDSL